MLVRVDRVLELTWLSADGADRYADEFGQPGIDPEAAVRLRLAGLLKGIVHDRRLISDASVKLAVRRFAGDAMAAALPDLSSPTRIRQRCGTERFRAMLVPLLGDCLGTGLVSGIVGTRDAP